MITIESLKTYQDTPPLRLLCLRKIIEEPKNLCRYVIPPEMGELLAMAYRDYAITNRLSEQECCSFYKHFRHKYIPLNKIDFSGLPITATFFLDFLTEYQNQLNEINISRCKLLTRKDLRKLTILKNNLSQPKILIIGETSSNDKESPWIVDTSAKYLPQDRIFDDDLRIKKLVLHKICPDSDEDGDEFTINRQLSEFLTPTMSSSLKYLDLSSCMIGNGSALMQLESLEILILYDCKMNYPNVISMLSNLKRLRTLDLSRKVVEGDEYSPASRCEEDPKWLDHLIKSLPHLSRLDLSGTNLIGGKDRNISAFEGRLERPFEFLGLFHTGNDAAYRSCIPALTVAGEANEAQILNACEAYMERGQQLSKALIDLFNLYKTITPTSETHENISRPLDVVLPILSRHMGDEQLMIYTTAALWSIVKTNSTSRNFNDARVRRTITSRLLDVMFYHKTSKVILINGGLTLLFLPDIICEHSRIATISLHMCRDQEPRTQSFGTTLLNALACQVGGDQKIFIGQQNAVETMIAIILAKIKDNNCDEILETAWSTLWNITDETPVNCERFLNCNGLGAFESCMDKFTNNKEVLRNIMGLLGNVAECKELRLSFMHARYIRRFEFLLSSQVDGIECSYNACGILAHLISDGQTFWDEHIQGSPGELASVRRCIIEERMCAAISKWPINSRRNINYRSFEPIVRLLDLHISPAAQYWAVFALANLTRINPAKYCPMLLPFGGLNKLRQLVGHPGSTMPYVENLAWITIYQYERFGTEQTLHGLEQCDSINLAEVRNFRAEPSNSNHNNNGDGTSEMGEMLL